MVIIKLSQIISDHRESYKVFQINISDITKYWLDCCIYEIGVVGIRGGWGEGCLNNNEKPTSYRSVFQSRMTTAYKLKLYTSTEK